MPQDEIFVPGTMADACYFVIEGSLNYIQSSESSPVTNLTRTPVRAGQWVCEAALWSHWIHVGTLTTESSQLLSIYANKMAPLLQRNRLIHDITVEYCRHFHNRITSAIPPNAPWPTDLSVPFTEYSDIV